MSIEYPKETRWPAPVPTLPEDPQDAQEPQEARGSQEPQEPQEQQSPESSGAVDDELYDYLRSGEPEEEEWNEFMSRRQNRPAQDESSWDASPGGSGTRTPQSDAPVGGGSLCRGCMALAEASGDVRELYCARFKGERHVYTSCKIDANSSTTAWKNWCRWAVCTPEQAAGRR